MMEFKSTDAGGFECIASGVHDQDEFTCGELRYGSPEPYWFFWPTSDQPLCVGHLNRIAVRLGLLNGSRSG